MPISVYTTAGFLVLLVWVAQRRLTGEGTHGIAIPVLAVLVAVFGWLGWTKWSTEQAATRATKEITGLSGVKVACRSWVNAVIDSPSHDGWVAANRDGTPTKTAWLSRDTCKALGEWLRGSKANPSDEAVRAVHVVAHEAAHLNSVWNEAAAECWAVQHNEEAAQSMGASAQQARTLSIRYYTTLYPRMRDNYRSAGCYEDGPDDLSPGDGHWP